MVGPGRRRFRLHVPTEARPEWGPPTVNPITLTKSLAGRRAAKAAQRRQRTRDALEPSRSGRIPMASICWLVGVVKALTSQTEPRWRAKLPLQGGPCWAEHRARDVV